MIDENLKKAIRDNKLVLFIGAGASISLKLPSWKNLVLGILEKLDLDFSEISDLNFSNLKNSLNSGFRSPLDILNKLENDSNSGALYKTKAKEYVYSVFNEINTSHSLDSELHKLLWELSQKIITTNYDQILEANQPNRTIDVFENANSFLARKSQQDDSKFLYKIHGDFKNPDSIVLFKSDYETIYAQQTSNSDALGDFFKNKTFLFLGFSLSDPFINDLFTKIKRLYNNYTVGNHYIFSTNTVNSFSEYDVKLIHINDWNKSLNDYLNELIKIKDSTVEIIDSEIEIHTKSDVSENDPESLFLIFNNKAQELRKNPGDKELASEIHNLKSKINELLYGDLDELVKIDTFKNTHIEVIFEAIYGNECLTNETVVEINKIRNDTKNYKWYERSQLVSALACSLVIFNKADKTKISLLIDFINDNEEKVWEKSLTYLVIILNHLGYKWVKYPILTNKINSLTQNSKVQEACQKILEYLLIFGIDIFNFSEKVFEQEYFQKPSNYFLPFFKEDNPMFEKIYENYTGENIENFINVLEKAPFPDSIKYVYCNTKRNINKKEDSADMEKDNFITNHLLINESFYPYAGIMQEFVSFVRSFPPIQHKKLLDTQIKLTSTPLKDYILNEKEKYRALGIHFFKEKQWGQAIINFNRYLDFEPKDLMILHNLESCFINNKEIEKAEDIVFKIREIFPNNIDNLISLMQVYIDRKKYEEAFEVSQECIKIDDGIARIYYLRAWIFYYRGKFENGLLELEKCSKLNYEDKAELNNVFSILHMRLEKYDLALKYINEAIELDSASKKAITPELYNHRSQIYEYLSNYNEALKDINVALTVDQDPLIMIDKVYILLKINDLKEAKILLNKINISQKKNPEYYNAKANYYRLVGDYDLALEMIEIAFELSKTDTNENRHYIGTKAAIYATMGDHDNFYIYLDKVLSTGEKASRFFEDVKNKYKNEKNFLEILEKYNQTI